jgi:transcriptional regulator of arginine metabolism
MRIVIEGEAIRMPTDHEQRETRQREILEILGTAQVTSQLELVEQLRGRGITATQSSVSRDLRDLGVAWIGGRYTVPPARRDGRDGRDGDAGDEAESPEVAEVARFLRAVKPAGPHLTVVLTVAGAAQGVGLAIDRAAWPEVVGTMAGDDTVFVATASARHQQRLIQRLEAFLEAR